MRKLSEYFWTGFVILGGIALFIFVFILFLLFPKEIAITTGDDAFLWLYLIHAVAAVTAWGWLVAYLFKHAVVAVTAWGWLVAYLFREDT